MSWILVVLILIGICSSAAISDWPSSYAQKTGLAAIKIIPSRISTTTTNSSSTKLTTVITNVALIPKIKILSPYSSQKIPIANNNNNNNLVVSGTII